MQNLKKKAVVFAPHPDDETLGCGGTVASRLNDGYDVHVVFITDGRHSLTRLGVSSGPSPAEIRELRREEVLRATGILGLQEKNLKFLDFEEGTLEKHENHLRERIAEILENVSPSEVFFPQEKEYHVDHRITNKIVREAIDIANISPVEYQYTIAWSFPFYLLWHVMNERMFDRFTMKFTGGKLVYLDISKFLHLKQMAINEYKSQIAVMTEGQKKPVLKRSFVKRFIKNRERFILS
jgi:LmbE family N-acetylglucosaminyl deacetylase